jgi:uncharacterized protein YciI
MQFLIIGLDGTDEKAMERRLAVREAHIKLGEEFRQAGNLWFGSALLDESGKMNGSMYLVDFQDEKELHAWLDREPYVTGDVWKTVEVRPANVRDPWQFSRSREFYEKRNA